MSCDIMSSHVISHFILDYILYHMLYCIQSVIFIYHISYSLSSVSETIYSTTNHLLFTVSNYFKWYHSMSFHIPYYPLMWYRVIYCIYVCLHIARICIFACMHVLVDHGMITCGRDHILILFTWLFARGCQRSSRFAGHWSWCNLRKTAGPCWKNMENHLASYTDTIPPTIAETLNWKIDANEAWCCQCAPSWFPTQLNEFCRYTHQISCCKKISMKMSKLNHILYLKQRRRKNPTVQFGPVPLESSSP